MSKPGLYADDGVLQSCDSKIISSDARKLVGEVLSSVILSSLLLVDNDGSIKDYNCDDSM
jgi:hypothetical protein